MRKRNKKAVPAKTIHDHFADTAYLIFYRAGCLFRHLSLSNAFNNQLNQRT